MYDDVFTQSICVYLLTRHVIIDWIFTKDRSSLLKKLYVYHVLESFIILFAHWLTVRVCVTIVKTCKKWPITNILANPAIQIAGTSPPPPNVSFQICGFLSPSHTSNIKKLLAEISTLNVLGRCVFFLKQNNEWSGKALTNPAGVDFDKTCGHVRSNTNAAAGCTSLKRSMQWPNIDSTDTESRLFRVLSGTHNTAICPGSCHI